MNVIDKPGDKGNNGLYGIMVNNFKRNTLSLNMHLHSSSSSFLLFFQIWDHDIGFGPKEDGVFEEYDCFSSSPDTSSSGEASTPPPSAEKKVTSPYISFRLLPSPLASVLSQLFRCCSSLRPRILITSFLSPFPHSPLVLLCYN